MQKGINNGSSRGAGGPDTNRQKSQSIQVLKALGILCFTQSNYGSALQSQHTTTQVSGMSTSSQGRMGVALGVSSSMMESEMNKIASEVENLVQENAQINTHLEEQLDEDQQIKQKKHHKKHHKKNKKTKPNRPSNGNNIGLQEQRTVDFGEKEARKRAMDQVRQELENSIQEQDENHPGGLTALQKQKLLSAAQLAEEDHDLDDPDFAGRKEQEEDREASAEQPVLPGQAAAEKILNAQKFAAQREIDDQKLEQEATARAHAMLTHSSTFSQSASQLASQLSSSIEDKQYPTSLASFQKPVAAPKKSYTPVQSEKTANLIAQAILHQQQKAAGISEEQIEQQSAANEEPAPFSNSLSNAARETRLSATLTKESAPVMTLGSQMQAQGRQSEQGFVTKDELIEGSKLKMSEQDQTASQMAVSATLAKIKGLSSQSTHSTLTPSPFVSSFSSLPKTTSTPAVKQSDTQSTFPTIAMPGPTPTPNPFPPIQKVQKPKQTESEDADTEKVDKKLSQKEEEEAEFDYMNDVEARQRKLVEKHQKAKKREEEGGDDSHDDDDKKVTPQAAPQTVVPVKEVIQAPVFVPKPKPAPVIVEKPVEKIPDFPMQQIPSPFVDPPSNVAQKPEVPVQSPTQMTQSEVVRRALEKIQKEKDSKKQSLSLEPSLPTYIVKPQVAAPVDKDSAVEKTLDIIKKNQEAQKQTNSLPAPFVDFDPQPAPVKAQEPAVNMSSKDIETQKKKVALLEKEAKLEEDAKQEEMKQAQIDQEAKKEEQQKAIIQKAIDAVQNEKQKQKKTVQTIKPQAQAPVKKVVPVKAPTVVTQVPAAVPQKKQPEQKNTQTKKSGESKPSKPGAKQNDDDEVAGYKITIDSLDIDDPTIKHDQAGGNPEDREKQKLAEKQSKMTDQKKKSDTQSMKQNKNDLSSSFSIETSGLDADDEDGANKKGGSSTNGLSNSQKQVLSSLSAKKAEEKKMKQNKKEEAFDFKIEETVATPEMIKHLVGDNTPDEEEELSKPVMVEKKIENPKVQTPKKVDVQKKQEAPKLVKIQKIKPVQAPKTAPAPTHAQTPAPAPAPAPTPTPASAKAAPIPQKQIMIRKIQKKQQDAKKPASIPKEQESTQKPKNEVSTSHLAEAPKDEKDQTQDLFKGIEAAIGELQGSSDASPEAIPDSSAPPQTSNSLSDFLTSAASALPSPHQQESQHTTSPSLLKTPSPNPTSTTAITPAPDMRSQIQSIVASIQPALQKAIGSKNTVKIQITVTDKDQNDKEKFKNSLNQAFLSSQKEVKAAGKKALTDEKKDKVQNVTISAQNEDHVKQIVDALNSHYSSADAKKGHMNVTVVAAPKQTTSGIVATANKYLESQNKLNQQVDNMKKQKEEEEYTAKIMSAMDLIQKQMDDEQKKQDQIKTNIISTAIKAAKEKEDAQQKALLEEQAAQQKQIEEQQKMRDDIIQRHIAMGKQQKQKEIDEAVKKSIQIVKTNPSQPVAVKQQSENKLEKAPVQSSPAPFVDPTPEPPLTDYQKAIQVTLAKAKEQNSSKKYGGVLSDLASSLEGTIVDEDEKQLAAPSSVASANEVFSQDSLKSQIVKNAIENGKKAQMMQSHPLSGGLFNHLTNLQATMSPTSTTSVAQAGLLFDGAQMMAQHANTTVPKTSQSLVANDKQSVKNLTKPVSVNTTKDSHVQIQVNKSKSVTTNETKAVVANNTIVIKANNSLKVNVSSMAQAASTINALTNTTKVLVSNDTSQSNKTKLTQGQTNQTSNHSVNSTKLAPTSQLSTKNNSITKNTTSLSTKNSTSLSHQSANSTTTSNASTNPKPQISEISQRKTNITASSSSAQLPTPSAQNKPVKTAVKAAKEQTVNATSKAVPQPHANSEKSQALNQVKSNVSSMVKAKDADASQSVMPITHKQLEEENESLKKQEKMLKKQIEDAKKEKEKKQQIVKPAAKNITQESALKKSTNNTQLSQKETGQVANKTSVKLELKSASKFDSKPMAAKIEQIKNVNEDKKANQSLATKSSNLKSQNITLIQKVDTSKSNTNQTASVNATVIKPVPKSQKVSEVEHADSNSSDAQLRPSSNTFTHLNSSNEASIDLVIEVPTTPVSDSQSRQSLASVTEKEKSNEKGGSASTVQAQVLNIATDAESKGSSLNQNNGVVQSVQSLVAKDLKLLDQEKQQEQQKQQDKSQEQKHNEEIKPAETHKVNPETETWFSASLNKFRSLKKQMFSAISFLPQTGEPINDVPPEDFENLQITNQQKLSMYEAQQSREQELTNQQKMEITDGFLNDESYY